MTVRLVAAVFLLGLADAAAALYADEPPFGYTYTTDLQEKGEVEYEQWVTDRHGQSRGRFDDLSIRHEIEYGVTDDLQVAVYVNWSTISASANDVEGGTSGLDIPESHDPARPYRATRFDGLSTELIYRLRSSARDGWGLAFYVEPEIGPREKALELRAIVQKNFFEDRLVLAGNLRLEMEREHLGGGKIEQATLAEIDLGASYRVARHWCLGVEVRNDNQYLAYGLAHGNQEHSADFIGPTIHFESRRWWATLTALEQFHAVAFNPEQRRNIVADRIYGGEHTRWDGLRLRLGISF